MTLQTKGNTLKAANRATLRTSRSVRAQVEVNEHVAYLAKRIQHLTSLPQTAIFDDEDSSQTTTNARYVIYALLKESGATYSQIARVFGKAHTSVSRTMKRLQTRNRLQASYIGSFPLLYVLHMVEEDSKAFVRNRTLKNIEERTNGTWQK